jgi:hypothetical protein
MKSGIYRKFIKTGVEELPTLLTKIDPKDREAIVNYRKLKNEKSPLAQDAKKNILSFTPAGVWENARSLKEPVQHSNHIIQIDIDTAGINKKEVFKKFDFIYAIGTSVGGKGTFILAQSANINTPIDWRYSKRKTYRLI